MRTTILADLAEHVRELADVLDGTSARPSVRLTDTATVEWMIQSHFDMRPEHAVALTASSRTDLSRSMLIKITAMVLATLASHGQLVPDHVRVTEMSDRVAGELAEAAPPISIRQEANALTTLALRNGFLEQLHMGEHADMLEDPGISRISDTEMKRLMTESSRLLADLLTMKEERPDKYLLEIGFAIAMYTSRWSMD